MVGVQDGQVYLAHVRPRDTDGGNAALTWQTTREGLARGLAQGTHFQGVTFDNPAHYVAIGGSPAAEVGMQLLVSHVSCIRAQCALSFESCDDQCSSCQFHGMRLPETEYAPSKHPDPPQLYHM